MQIKKQRITVMLVAVGLGLAHAGVQAQELIPPDPGRANETERDTPNPEDAESYNRADRAKPADVKHGQQMKASKFIGTVVRDDQGERLGKVDDLIINPNYAVQFAVISSGGALGIGDKRIAVPIHDLNCSAEGAVSLATTAEQFKNASKTPTGGWLAVSGEEWTRDIDGYYGQPEKYPMTKSGGFSQTARTFERESASSSSEREPVRAVQGDGARQLITHPDHADLFNKPLFGKGTGDTSPAPATDTSDETMQQRISDTLRQNYSAPTPEGISVTVQNGVVTLRGTAADEAEKRNMETTVKQMSGVRRVNNQLTVQNR